MSVPRPSLHAGHATTAVIQRPWLKPIIATVGVLWLGFYGVNIIGTEAIIRAGWHVQYDALWIISLLLLRCLIYSVLIQTVRKRLTDHQFNSDEINKATWMLVRVLCVYECLFGLNLFGYLNDWVST